VEEAQRRLAGLHGFWARFAPREVLAALVEGNLLARERLDDLLRRLDVREIPCLGKPFDPTLMQAAEVVHTTTASPGTVLEVFRPGYISNGRVLRFAEVRVVAEARDASAS
jgi:molecular chaperone GrpE (heat shock protein)